MKVPQLIIFGNGNGNFDMGSPIDYERPLSVFDYAKFKDLIDLVNSYGEKGDGRAKSDPFSAEKFEKIKRAANAGVIHCETCGSNYIVDPDSTTHKTGHLKMQKIRLFSLGMKQVKSGKIGKGHSEFNRLLLFLLLFFFACGPNDNTTVKDVEIINGDTLLTLSYFNKGGSKNALIRYKNSLMHGTSETYFENGILKFKKSFFNDKEFGSFLQYTRSGKLERYSFLVDSIRSSYDRYYDLRGNLIRIEGDPLTGYKVENSHSDSVRIKVFFSDFGNKKLDAFISTDQKQYKPFPMKKDRQLEHLQFGIIEDQKKKESSYTYYFTMKALDEENRETVFSDSISFFLTENAPGPPVLRRMLNK